jgi:hypothetical protein
MEHLPWAAFGLWVLKEFYSAWKDDRRRNTDALMQNSQALFELKLEIKNIRIALEEIPRLKKDIDAAHNKFREKGL